MKTKWLAVMVALTLMVAGVGTAWAAPATAERAAALVTGEVTAIDGAVITIQQGQRPAVTVLTDAETRFHSRINGALTLSDINTGDHVTARGRWQNGQLLARDVLLLPDRLGGRVTAINGTTIALVKIDGTAASVATNAQTQFRSPDKPNATLADVKVGDGVEAVGELTGDTLTAVQVNFRTPRLQTGPIALGAVESVSDTGFILNVGFGETLTVNTTGNTLIVRRGENGPEQITLSDLTSGDRVMVIGLRSSDGASMEARAILVGQGANANRRPLPQPNRTPQGGLQNRGPQPPTL